MMEENNNIFEPETVYYPDRERLEVFEKQISLLDTLLEEFKTADMTTSEAINIFFSRVKQVYQDYQHQLSELQYDILSEFKDLPGFKNWFKKLLPEGKKEKEDPYQKFALYRLSKTDMINKLNVLMKQQAKSLVFNALLIDIYYTALEKLYMIKKGVPTVTIKPSELGMPLGKKIAMEILIENKDRKVVAEKYGVKAPNVRSYIHDWKPKLEKEGLLQAKITS